MRAHPLRTYLDDHRAGAAAGLALARRVAARYGDESLHTLAQEIAEDTALLDRAREHLGVGGRRWKQWIAVAGERVRRLKHLGSDQTSLVRLEELELLAAGVSGKLRLWEALDVAGVSTPAGIDPGALRERARLQLASIERLHRSAASAALGS